MSAASTTENPPRSRAALVRRPVAVVAVLVALLLGGSGAAWAGPIIDISGPAGNAHITLGPSMFPGRLALTYDLQNTAGATGGSVTLTPVGLNAAPRTDTFGGSRVRSTVLYPYTPGTEVSVGVHVVFLTPEGVQDDSADPFVVSYPS